MMWIKFNHYYLIKYIAKLWVYLWDKANNLFLSIVIWSTIGGGRLRLIKLARLQCAWAEPPERLKRTYYSSPTLPKVPLIFFLSIFRFRRVGENEDRKDNVVYRFVDVEMAFRRVLSLCSTNRNWFSPLMRTSSTGGRYSETLHL